MPQPKKRPPAEASSQRERLSMALDVINRTDMTPEEKLGLEAFLLESYDESRSRPTDSATSSPPSASPTSSGPGSSAPSLPDADYWRPSPTLNLRQEDWNEFLIETTNRFLLVLQEEATMLSSLASSLPPEGSHLLPMETQAAMIEMARLTALKINLAASAAAQSDLHDSAEPNLLVPDKTLLDQNGNPLGDRLSRSKKGVPDA